MDKEIKDHWEKSMEMLMALSPAKRKHFALLLVNLADCYADDGVMAAVIISRDDNLMMFSAGATEFECAEMLSRANALVQEVATSDAPPKEMFN
jgi:hypothetical protein